MVEPLIDDEYTGEPPAKRLLAYLQAQRERGARIVGIYCGYAPVELIRALDLVPASLCAFSNATIEAAEAVLPANLCPLIKSSYGFIMKDACPFFAMSDAVIGETTCDGKKKMFELIADRKPMHVMDLPQLPDEPEAIDDWAAAIRKLRRFLESVFGRTATDDRIEAAIRDTNAKSRRMNEVFDYAALNPPGDRVAGGSTTCSFSPRALPAPKWRPYRRRAGEARKAETGRVRLRPERGAQGDGNGMSHRRRFPEGAAHHRRGGRGSRRAGCVLRHEALRGLHRRRHGRPRAGHGGAIPEDPLLLHDAEQPAVSRRSTGSSKSSGPTRWSTWCSRPAIPTT